MYAFEIGLAVAILLILYSYLRIKWILRNKGYEVAYLVGWISDYKAFVKMIAVEEDSKVRNRYISIIIGLHAGFILLICIAGLGVFIY